MGKKVPVEVSEYLSAIGRRGGRIGGKNSAALLTPEERAEKASTAGLASAEALTPEQRRERARLAAQKRWGATKKRKGKS